MKMLSIIVDEFLLILVGKLTALWRLNEANRVKKGLISRILKIIYIYVSTNSSTDTKAIGGSGLYYTIKDL